MKIQEILVEGHETYYHSSPIEITIRILASKELKGTAMGSNNEMARGRPITHYSLSVARSMRSSFYDVILSNTHAIMVLDGNSLRHHNKVRPYNYVDSRGRTEREDGLSAEEDRVDSPNPIMPIRGDTSNTIRSIHMCNLIDPEIARKAFNSAGQTNFRAAKTLADMCKNEGIPLFVYNTFNEFRWLKNGHQV